MTAIQIGPSHADDGRSSELRKRLEHRTRNNQDFWSFQSLRNRTGNHALFQYPAMMVPELQGALLDDAQAVDKDINLIYDPFSGSGTVMLESLYRGFDFYGSDINPLAILLCEVKAAPPSALAALEAISRVIEESKDRTGSPMDFPYIDKWFKPEIKDGLSKIRCSIIDCDNPIVRKFLWICLAETVRLTSNSRISTFKLHSYAPADILRRGADALKVFKSVAEQNAEHLKRHWQRMEKNTRLEKKPCAILTAGLVSEASNYSRLADVLMTSPPYGDNKTTVPYGQHSYLPLCWIDARDLHEGFNSSMLDTTSRIDTMSLGGSLKFADHARDELAAVSPSLRVFIKTIQETDSLRKKVLSFCRDYRQSLKIASTRLKAGGFCFFTLGERRVGKQTFPLVDITKEFLLVDGHEIVATIERVLPASRKRMAAKNSEGSTMAKEWILVTRSRGVNNG